MWSRAVTGLCLLLLSLAFSAEADRKTTRKPGDDQEVSCRNPKGEIVEWFIIYKVPRDTEVQKGINYARRGRRVDPQDGTEFGYFDSTMTGNATLFDGPSGIDVEDGNPLATSLSQLFKMDAAEAQKRLTYVVYNDQPPSEKRERVFDSEAYEKTGHTKGVVVFGQDKGLWLVHSVPHFPADFFQGKYSYPRSGHQNAQSAFCVSLGADQLETVAAHLRRQQPVMYEFSAPEEVRNSHPELDLLLKKEFANGAPFHVQDVLTGVKGTKFTAFAKSGFLDEEIYRDVIGPYFKSNLFVQTWRNGPGGKLPADCDTPYKILDVTEVALRLGSKTLKWSTHDDHAKWAITESGNWVCIGSINRMHSQFTRGGETMCIEHGQVHEIFRQAIADSEKCPNQKRPRH